MTTFAPSVLILGTIPWFEVTSAADGHVPGARV